MTLLRPLFGLCLALMLALTSVTMAEARHYGPIGASFVICANGMAQTITLDATGHKVPFSHNCPDCIVAAMDVPATTSLPHRPDFVATLALPMQPVAKVRTIRLHPDARGPPVLM